jgi:4-hydroxybenzoate polyprenyltransferase
MRDKAPETDVYFRLMRLYQPTGIWLLLWPCWWAVALASPEFPSLWTLLLFLIGAFLMRPVGCIVNDLADRKLDAQVARTKSRPLASGEITTGEAIRLMIWLLFLAFWVAFALGDAVIQWSLYALPLVLLYPWMKRITWWPQLFLGLTFNWGALLGWIAVRGTIEWPALWLYIGGVFWTLGYDTIYAHQDKLDDTRVGVKSSALRLGDHTKPALVVFYTLAALCWAASGRAVADTLPFYGFLGVAWLHLLWQVKRLDIHDPASCQNIFVSNGILGWLVFAACIVANL